jgi:hypothetical protein
VNDSDALTPLHIEMLRWLRSIKMSTVTVTNAWGRNQIPQVDRASVAQHLEYLRRLGYVFTELRGKELLYRFAGKPIPTLPPEGGEVQGRRMLHQPPKDTPPPSAKKSAGQSTPPLPAPRPRFVPPPRTDARSPGHLSVPEAPPVRKNNVIHLGTFDLIPDPPKREPSLPIPLNQEIERGGDMPDQGATPPPPSTPPPPQPRTIPSTLPPAPAEGAEATEAEIVATQPVILPPPKRSHKKATSSPSAAHRDPGGRRFLRRGSLPPLPRSAPEEQKAPPTVDEPVEQEAPVSVTGGLRIASVPPTDPAPVAPPAEVQVAEGLAPSTSPLPAPIGLLPDGVASPDPVAPDVACARTEPPPAPPESAAVSRIVARDDERAMEAEAIHDTLHEVFFDPLRTRADEIEAISLASPSLDLTKSIEELVGEEIMQSLSDLHDRLDEQKKGRIEIMRRMMLLDLDMKALRAEIDQIEGKLKTKIA